MPDHIMNVDCLWNIELIYTPTKPTAPSNPQSQIIDTFTWETETSRQFHPSTRQYEYTMLLDLQEMMSEQSNNSLPRVTK